MAYIFDSDVLIDFFNRKGAGFQIIRQLSDEYLSLSVATYIEVKIGFIREQKDATQFIDFVKENNIQIEPLKKKAADKFVEIKLRLEKEGKVISDFDLVIAATAIIRDAVLVTHNIKHFSRIKELKIYK